MREFLAQLPWPLLVVLCLTLGLAPFSPPHIVEKIQMLSQGTLKKPLDWFDFFFHAIPWLLLVIKGGYAILDSYLPK